MKKTLTSTAAPVISLFNFKGNDVRVVTLAGEPWHVAADVCECLDLRPAPSNGSYQNHYKRLAEDELSLTTIRQPNGQNIRMKLISESGLYKLVLRSDKPEAKEFQDWVTKVVLPSVRKDGGYVHGEEKLLTGQMSEDEFMAKALLMAGQKLERLTAERNAAVDEARRTGIKLVAVEGKLVEAQPKIELAGHVQSEERSLTTVIRTFKGVNSNRIKSDLMDAGYLYKVAGEYRTRAKYRVTHFPEHFVEGVNWAKHEITVTDKGYEAIAMLYAARKLTMLKSYRR